MAKLSIIIPVYNVAPYLRAGLDSVVKQWREGVEVVAVNDGSKDDSLEILRDYERRYPFLKVIDQPNAGVSVARNAGIEATSGEWVTFMDPDDAYVDGAIAYLLDAVKKTTTDIVYYDSQVVYDQSEVVPLIKGSVRTVDLNDRGQVLDAVKTLCPIAWNCCYRRSALGSIRYVPGLAKSQDVVYGFTCFCKARAIEVHATKLYKYYQRIDSCVHTVSEKRIRGDIDSSVYIFKEARKWKWYEDCKRVIFRKVRINAIGEAIELIQKIKTAKRDKLWNYFFDRLTPVFTSKGFVPIWQRGLYSLAFGMRSPLLVKWMLYQPYRLAKFALTSRILLAFWKKIR